jgi:hypothetical protein
MKTKNNAFASNNGVIVYIVFVKFFEPFPFCNLYILNVDFTFVCMQMETNVCNQSVAKALF